jgi:hypothetical protein
MEEKKTSDDETLEEQKSDQIVNDTEAAVAESPGFNTNLDYGQSKGVSAFDGIFGGVEDAPLSPLEAFSPKVEQGLKTEEVEPSEFDDSFGDFQGNAVVTEAANADFSPADDTFGHFDSIPQPMNGVPEALMEVSVHTDDEAPLRQDTSAPLESDLDVGGFDDDFGDFAAVAHEQSEVAPEDNEGAFLAFGPKDTTANREQIIHPETTTDHSNQSTEEFGHDFGDFSGFEQADPEQLEGKMDHALESDNFGDFTAFGSTDMANAEDETGHIQENDIVTASEQSETATELECNDPIENQSDFEDFDVFESADVAITEDTEQLEPATQLQGKDFVCNESGDEDFGDFNAFESQDAEDTIELAQSQHTASEADAADDFGDFAAGTFDAEFGEFEEFDSAPPENDDASSNVHPNPHSGLKEKLHALGQLAPPLPSNTIIIECFEKCSNLNEVRLLFVCICNAPLEY